MQIIKKTTTRKVKWSLNLATEENIDLKFGTGSQTHENSLFLLHCVINVCTTHFQGDTQTNS